MRYSNPGRMPRRRELSVPLLDVHVDVTADSVLEDAPASASTTGAASAVRRTVRILNSPAASVPLPLEGQAKAPLEFAANAITTRKYDPWITFPALFLFDTFRKLANSYFLVVAGLQCVEVWSATDGLPTS